MRSCKKATFLISKKEDGKLTTSEAIGLAWHLSVCSLCRSFEKQTGFFSSRAKNSQPEHDLTNDAKERLKKNLQKWMDN